MATISTTPTISPDISARLIAEARAAALRAYAPYSNFRVGAAVLGGSGIIHRGVNIENASYGLGVCAERTALAAARIAGETRIDAIAVACIDAPPDSPLGSRMPCGTCRQWIQELAPNAAILIAGEERAFHIAELLPHPFKLEK